MEAALFKTGSCEDWNVVVQAMYPRKEEEKAG
jgi:hypothetical protein